MRTRVVLPVLLCALLVGCATVPRENSVYQSNAPEVRGERAISSNIELAAEVDLGGSTLGVFYASEVYQNGSAQTLLFTRRIPAAFSDRAGTITDYDLSETSSLSVDQGRKLLGAVEEYLAKDPKTLQPSQMFNFELYSGTVDMSVGTDYHPFKEVTFAVVCSVTSTGKRFRTVFPIVQTNLYQVKSTSYQTFDLTPEQVQKLHDALKQALAKAPAASSTPARTPGT
jgi:hypothetical protein